MYRVITTYHCYDHHGFFRPLIAEVLAQIPEEDLERAVAFEIEHVGFSDGDKYHTAKTKLYERRPEPKLRMVK